MTSKQYICIFEPSGSIKTVVPLLGIGLWPYTSCVPTPNVQGPNSGLFCLWHY